MFSCIDQGISDKVKFKIPIPDTRREGHAERKNNDIRFYNDIIAQTTKHTPTLGTKLSYYDMSRSLKDSILTF